MQEKWLLIKKALRLFPSQKRFHKAAATKVINCWPNYVLFKSWIDLIFSLLPLPFIDWKKKLDVRMRRALFILSVTMFLWGEMTKEWLWGTATKTHSKIQALCYDTDSSDTMYYLYTTRLLRIQNGSFNICISTDQIINTTVSH